MFHNSAIFVLLLVAACATKPSEETSTEQAKDSTALELDDQALPPFSIDYPFDSLLGFDSEAQLIEAYGKDNVVRELRYCPEGLCDYDASILFKGTAAEVEFMWKDDSVNFNTLMAIETYGTKPIWKTKSGIGIGTTVKELEKMNGKPFRFAGFGWDYGGTTFLEDGKLKDAGVWITLGVDDNPHPDADSLLGDSDFTTDMPLVQKVNPIVTAMTMSKSN